MLLTKSVLKFIIVLSNYQTWTFPLRWAWKQHAIRGLTQSLSRGLTFFPTIWSPETKTKSLQDRKWIIFLSDYRLSKPPDCPTDEMSTRHLLIAHNPYKDLFVSAPKGCVFALHDQDYFPKPNFQWGKCAMLHEKQSVEQDWQNRSFLKGRYTSGYSHP